MAWTRMLFSCEECEWVSRNIQGVFGIWSLISLGGVGPLSWKHRLWANSVVTLPDSEACRVMLTVEARGSPYEILHKHDLILRETKQTGCRSAQLTCESFYILLPSPVLSLASASVFSKVLLDKAHEDQIPFSSLYVHFNKFFSAFGLCCHMKPLARHRDQNKKKRISRLYDTFSMWVLHNILLKKTFFCLTLKRVVFPKIKILLTF